MPLLSCPCNLWYRRIDEQTCAGEGVAAAKFVEIVCFFHTDFFICGIAPLNDNLVLLAFVVDEEAREAGAQRPELRIVARWGCLIFPPDCFVLHAFVVDGEAPAA